MVHKIALKERVKMLELRKIDGRTLKIDTDLMTDVTNDNININPNY